MGKILRKFVLAAGLVLFPIFAISQEDEPVNYIPSTLETLVNNDGGKGIGLTQMEKDERRARIANSVFLYEGYESVEVEQANEHSFGKRFSYNFEKELQDVNSFRFFDNEDYIIQDDLRAFPFEREAYSALGKTLIEKYKFARDVDKAIRKARDATTVSVESKSGVKYRMGLFVGESELGAVGAFLKIKNGCFNTVVTACQNEIDAYIEKKFGRFDLRGGYKYETGANGNVEERKFYFSLQGKRF